MSCLNMDCPIHYGAATAVRAAGGGVYNMILTTGGVTPDLEGVTINSAGSKLIGVPICPDLLDIADIGAADNLRGRIVRAFFTVLALFEDLLAELEPDAIARRINRVNDGLRRRR